MVAEMWRGWFGRPHPSCVDAGMQLAKAWAIAGSWMVSDCVEGGGAQAPSRPTQALVVSPAVTEQVTTAGSAPGGVMSPAVELAGVDTAGVGMTTSAGDAGAATSASSARLVVVEMISTT